jgi:polyphosphate kinase
MAMAQDVREPETVDDQSRRKLKAKQYDRLLFDLHVELVKLQEWVKHKGLKVCIVFEGRDGAGKGGTIKAITERVSPRVFRVVALTCADGKGEVADVHPAISSALARCGRGRDLRP